MRENEGSASGSENLSNSFCSLAGQPALVTGANSGIGRAICLALASAGADIVINFIENPVAADDLAQEIATVGRRCITVKGDVSKEADVALLFNTAIRHYGTLHIVVGNAGIQRDAPLELMSLEQWQSVIDINLTGQFLCAREAAREFLRRGSVPSISKSVGKILLISSVHESLPWSGRANYAASKAGGAMFMRSIAQELAPKRIRVNALAPGAIRTPINAISWSTPSLEKELSARIPCGRIGEPEDVARCAAWLLSDAADYVSGSTIYIDGGLSGKVG